MRHILKVLIVIAWIFRGLMIAGHKSDTKVVNEAGVSYELAKLRSATIDSVVYDLEFYIPKGVTDRCDGRVSISFVLDKDLYDNDIYIESFGCSGISSPSATTVIVKSVILFS